MKGQIVATLPDVPQNTIVAIAVLAGTGLVAFSTHHRAKLDSQIHENYRHAKVVDANVHAGTSIPSIHADQSPRSA
jgi:hypothetical protein